MVCVPEFTSTQKNPDTLYLSLPQSTLYASSVMLSNTHCIFLAGFRDTAAMTINHFKASSLEGVSLRSWSRWYHPSSNIHDLLLPVVNYSTISRHNEAQFRSLLAMSAKQCCYHMYGKRFGSWVLHNQRHTWISSSCEDGESIEHSTRPYVRNARSVQAHFVTNGEFTPPPWSHTSCNSNIEVHYYFDYFQPVHYPSSDPL